MSKESRRPEIFSLVWCAAVLITMWLLDYPKPFWDDLFYCGPAFNLAAGGDLSNPLLIRQQLPGHFFFVYPPLYCYALAYWLKLLGISAMSVTGFQLLMYLVTGFSTVSILRRHESPALLEWMVPLAIVAACLPLGLRTESFGIALVMAGFAILECSRPEAWERYVAYTLMALGPSASPRIAPYSALLLLFDSVRYLRKCGWRRQGVLEIAKPAAAAGAVTLLLFLLMIHFRIAEFWTAFHFHASRIMESKTMILSMFFTPLLVKGPLTAVFLIFVLLTWRHRDNEMVQLGWLLAASWPVLALLGTLGSGAIWFALFAIILLGSVLLKQFNGLRFAALQLMILVFFIGLNFHTGVELIGLLRGQISPDLGEQQQLARSVKPSPGHAVLVDGGSARYLFGYRIPKGFINIEFGSKFPGTFVTCDELVPGDTFIACDGILSGFVRDTYLEMEIPKKYPIGVRRWAVLQYPRRVHVLTAEDCKKVRPDRPYVTSPYAASRHD